MKGIRQKFLAWIRLAAPDQATAPQLTRDWPEDCEVIEYDYDLFTGFYDGLPKELSRYRPLPLAWDCFGNTVVALNDSRFAIIRQVGPVEYFYNESELFQYLDRQSVSTPLNSPAQSWSPQP
jgi:hypothetical protein